MSSVSMKVFLNQNLITPALARIQSQLQALPAQAYMEFVKNTPIRSGNARRKTSIQNNNKIRAAYPYATRLDAGYSKQRPAGMTKPTRAWIKKQTRQILRKR
jgi:hypothetical protein